MYTTGITAARRKEVNHQYVVSLAKRRSNLVEEIIDGVLTVFVAGRKDFNERDDTVASRVINHYSTTSGDVEGRISGRFESQGDFGWLFYDGDHACVVGCCFRRPPRRCRFCMECQHVRAHVA